MCALRAVYPAVRDGPRGPLTVLPALLPSKSPWRRREREALPCSLIEFSIERRQSLLLFASNR